MHITVSYSNVLTWKGVHNKKFRIKQQNNAQALGLDGLSGYYLNQVLKGKLQRVKSELNGRWRGIIFQANAATHEKPWRPQRA